MKQQGYSVTTTFLSNIVQKLVKNIKLQTNVEDN